VTVTCLAKTRLAEPRLAETRLAEPCLAETCLEAWKRGVREEIENKKGWPAFAGHPVFAR
jgi:hypothetical protein